MYRNAVQCMIAMLFCGDVAVTACIAPLDAQYSVYLVAIVCGGCGCHSGNTCIAWLYFLTLLWPSPLASSTGGAHLHTAMRGCILSFLAACRARAFRIWGLVTGFFVFVRLCTACLSRKCKITPRGLDAGARG